MKVQASSSATPSDKTRDAVDSSKVTSTSTVTSSSTSKVNKPEDSKPDSTIQKPSKPVLVDATYFDDSEDEDSSSSDYDSAEEEKKKAAKKKKENPAAADVDIDLDDIDKALDIAFEKKKVGGSTRCTSFADNLLTELTLVQRAWVAKRHKLVSCL